jgi:hypothetical protein
LPSCSGVSENFEDVLIEETIPEEVPKEMPGILAVVSERHTVRTVLSFGQG